jgi:hypothetical protein
MARKSLRVGALLIAVAACSTQRTPRVATTSADAPLTAAERRIEDVFAFGEKLGHSRSEVGRKLRAPLTVQVVMVPNQYTSDVDSGFVVAYRHWTLAYLRVRATGLEFVTDIRLTGSVSLPGRLQCGRARFDEVVSLLGPPTEQRQVADTVVGSYLRPIVGGPEEHIEFMFVDGTLRAVHWQVYVD